jgi:undecaprenyl-diphosphatase
MMNGGGEIMTVTEFLQIIVLALIQGITEFLPISSSGHLILVPAITGWKDQGVLTDMVTNVGSLTAVIIYFWRDVLGMMRGSLDLLQRRMPPPMPCWSSTSCHRHHSRL